MQFKDGEYSKRWRKSQAGFFAMFKTFVKAVRNFYFNSFYQLLKHDDLSMSLMFAFVCIKSLQMMLAPFANSVVGIWKFDPVSFYLNWIFNIVTISPAVASLGFAAHLILGCVFLTVLLLQLIGLFIVSKKNLLQTLNSDLVIKGTKILLRASTTFLTIPYTLSALLTFSCQTSATGELVLTFSESTVCFQGFHWISCAVSLLIFLLFVPTGILVSFWFIETSYLKNQPMAQAPSFLNTFTFMYKILLALLVDYASYQGVEYLLIGLMVVLNGILCWINASQNPYYDFRVGAMILATYVANEWGGAMLLIARIGEGNWITGSLVIWLIVLPFFYCYGLKWRPNKLKLLLFSIDKAQSGDAFLKQLIYLLQLLVDFKNDTESRLIIEGFVDTHTSICAHSECPINPSKISSRNGTETSEVFVIRYLNFAYQKAIHKFPTNIQLKLYYILYLLEVAKKPLEALVMLEGLSVGKFNLLYYFVIQRFLRSVQEISTDSEMLNQIRKDSSIDVNDVPLQSLMKQFNKEMENVTILHTEIWGHLQEETPNLKRLLRVGTQILLDLTRIEKTWQKFYKFSLNNRAKYLLIYGKFLKNVVNDQARGQALIQEAWQLLQVAINRRSDMNFISLDQDIHEVSVPMIAVSGSKINFGSIVKVNASAAIFFGYTISELMGENIKKLIPRTFNMHHDAYLERAIKSSQLVYMQKARTVYAKTSTGYLLPLVINIKAIFGSEPIFYSQFRSIKSSELIAYILTDYKGRIEAVSTQTIQLFGVMASDILTCPHINGYFSGIFDERERLCEIVEETLDLSNAAQKIKEHIGSNKVVKVSVESQKHYLMIKEYYIFRFRAEPVLPIESGNKTFQASEFNFQINSFTKQIVGRPFSMGKWDFDDDPVNASYRKSLHQKTELNETATELSIRYSKGIKVFRLDSGKIVEKDEDMENDLNDRLRTEEAIKAKMDREKQKKEEDIAIEAIQKKLSNLQNAQEDIHKRSVNVRAKIYALMLVMLLACVLAIVVYIFNNVWNLWQKLPKYYWFYINYDLTVSELLSASQVVQRLSACKEYLCDESLEQELRSFLRQIGQVLQISVSFLEVDSKELKDSVLDAALIYDTYNIQKDSQNLVEMNYLAVMKHMITSVLLIQSLPLSQFTLRSSADTVMFVENILDRIHKKQIETLDTILEHLNSFAKNSLTIVVAQFGKAMLCGLCLLLVLIYKHLVIRKLNDCLLLFLDVPHSKGRKYQNRCENFLKRLQTQNFDEIYMEEDEEQEHSEESHEKNLIIGRKRRRNRAIKLKLPNSVLIKFGVAFVVICMLFVSFIFIHEHCNNIIASKHIELDLLSKMSPSFHYTLNNHLYDLSRVLSDDFDITEVDTNLVKDFIVKVNEYGNKLDQIFISNSYGSSSVYEATIRNIRQNSLCDFLGFNDFFYTSFYKPLQEECAQLERDPNFGKAVHNGITLTLNVYQDRIQTSMSNMITIITTKSLNSIAAFGSDVCKKAVKMSKFCIFSEESLVQTFFIQNMYVDYFAKQLLGLFNENIVNSVLPYVRNFMIFTLLINITIILVLGYWCAFVEFLKDYQRTRKVEQIVFVIPLENLEASPDMRQLFEALFMKISEN